MKGRKKNKKTGENEGETREKENKGEKEEKKGENEGEKEERKGEIRKKGIKKNKEKGGTK